MQTIGEALYNLGHFHADAVITINLRVGSDELNVLIDVMYVFYRAAKFPSSDGYGGNERLLDVC